MRGKDKNKRSYKSFLKTNRDASRSHGKMKSLVARQQKHFNMATFPPLKLLFVLFCFFIEFWVGRVKKET